MDVFDCPEQPPAPLLPGVPYRLVPRPQLRRPWPSASGFLPWPRTDPTALGQLPPPSLAPIGLGRPPSSARPRTATRMEPCTSQTTPPTLILQIQALTATVQKLQKQHLMTVQSQAKASARPLPQLRPAILHPAGNLPSKRSTVTKLIRGPPLTTQAAFSLTDGDAEEDPSKGSGTSTPTNLISWGADHQQAKVLKSA